MYLKIKLLNDKLVKDAEKSLSKNVLKELEKKFTYRESIVSRYLISQYKWKYSSISHKRDIVFIWVSDNKIGVDIENYKERDINILDTFTSEEYEIVWNKSRKKFYLLWTAKESIVKLLNIMLDDIGDIKLISCQKHDEKLSNIKFSYKLNFVYNRIKISVISWINKEYYYSIWYKN